MEMGTEREWENEWRKGKGKGKGKEKKEKEKLWPMAAHSQPPSRPRGWQRCPVLPVPCQGHPQGLSCPVLPVPCQGHPRAPGLGGSAVTAQRSLLAISACERSLHFPKEGKRMRNITSQLGWSTERQDGDQRGSSEELLPGKERCPRDAAGMARSLLRFAGLSPAPSRCHLRPSEGRAALGCHSGPGDAAGVARRVPGRAHLWSCHSGDTRGDTPEQPHAGLGAGVAWWGLPTRNIKPEGRGAVRAARDIEDHPVAPPAVGRDTFHWTRLLQAPSWNTSRDGWGSHSSCVSLWFTGWAQTRGGRSFFSLTWDISEPSWQVLPTPAHPLPGLPSALCL
ncbi:uncharacterized protein LOC119709998 isoform X2 [Motacilla alba alba]|uniref:uncharacterized protein LOC119709998 isoform X2 n=1 Tax=Motacilla alba alba TaxID=1094192 RepID=UPI0018D574B5|nr:uncharacterized protein LOC119709998 isoform X2 [Motacilla alba alba]